MNGIIVHSFHCMGYFRPTSGKWARNVSNSFALRLNVIVKLIKEHPK